MFSALPVLHFAGKTSLSGAFTLTADPGDNGGISIPPPKGMLPWDRSVFIRGSQYHEKDSIRSTLRTCPYPSIPIAVFTAGFDACSSNLEDSAVHTKVDAPPSVITTVS